jgi:hypothetical protein
VTIGEPRLLLIVEGVDDVRRLRRLLPELGVPHLVLDGKGFRGVRETCQALSSGFDQPYLGVCDRDLKSDEDVDAQRERLPSLFFLPSRCLENELLHPPLLSRALDMSGHEITEAEIRAALRKIADEQYEAVHARMVDDALRHAFNGPFQREEDETPIRLVRRQYEGRRNSAQNRVLAITEMADRVERELRGRWDAEHLALFNGKTAFPKVAQQLAPQLKGRRGLEAAVLRHALDSPPPGIAALRSEVERLLRGE